MTLRPITEGFVEHYEESRSLCTNSLFNVLSGVVVNVMTPGQCCCGYFAGDELYALQIMTIAALFVKVVVS